MNFKDNTYIKWNTTALKRLSHDLQVIFKRNCDYLRNFIGIFIVQKSQEFERSGLCTKTSYLRKKMKPFIQITAILCLVSFAIMSQIIAIHNYHEDKNYVSQIKNNSGEKEEASLAKRILWTISK